MYARKRPLPFREYNMEKEHGEELYAHIPFVDVDSKSPPSVYSHLFLYSHRERKD
jgi:hypothetical protein